MQDNLKKFNKIWQRIQNENMVFISSNSGTGKTTFFKWLLCRQALKGHKIDILYRFETDLEEKFTIDKFLTPPQNASKRLLKLIAKLDIMREGNDCFLINKETKEKIGQGLAVNTQRKYKSTENAIFTEYAFFDEIMPDDNVYCNDEVYKFSRLIDSRARYRNYKVIGLYNKVCPYFPYKESFEKAGALFIDFVGKKYGQDKLQGLQKILSLSDYGSIYNNNDYAFFKEFYKPENTYGKETIFYISIQNKLFAFKDFDDYYILTPSKKTKPNREIFAIAMENNDFKIVSRASGLLQALTNAFNERLVFTNKKNLTIYIKNLADFLNVSYNI